MKKIFAFVIINLVVFQFSTAQVVIPIPTFLKDVLSRKNYREINNINYAALRYTGTSSGFITGFSEVIENQDTELSMISKRLLSQKMNIMNFVASDNFSAHAGYNSYGYIKEKYPVINPFNLSPSETLRNKIIRARFYKKLYDERSKLNDYFNPENPIPEGERILLILNSLDKVINIVIENEEF